MALTAFTLLVLIALVCTVASLISPPKYPLLSVAVLLVCIALLVGGR